MQWTSEQMYERDDVGICHETYLMRAGEYDTVYRNAPPIELGKAGTLSPASERRRTAAGRLGWTAGDDVSYDGKSVESDTVEPPKTGNNE